MHLVNLTAGIKRIVALITALFIYTLAIAQENSPYSRYVMGDVLTAQNMSNRSMGGISAGYAGFITTPRKPILFSLNLSNPASLGYLNTTILDLGGEIDRKTLKSNISPNKYTSTNTVISYLQFGVPVASKKMIAKNRAWGFSMNLRPVTRISYKIERNERLSGIDSLNTIYEGDGGINQASISTGYRIKNFSFGITAGYNFGSKDYSTRLSFINDSVLYYKSNSETKTTFSGASISAGILYDVHIKEGDILRLGAYADFQHKLKAGQSMIDETFAYNGSGGVFTIDTVKFQPDIKGTIVYPATYALGFTRVKKRWLYGADFEMTSWNNFRYYGGVDSVKNSWKVKVGGQYRSKKEILFRGGAYIGPDFVKLDDSKRSEFGLTLGAGLPVIARGEMAYLNLGAEFAARGNKDSRSMRESTMRFTVGISINGNWFIKRKYD